MPMKLSKIQLEILSEKLSQIIQNKKEAQTRDFICNVDFEEMLCLAANTDFVTANRIYQNIYEDADSTMGLKPLSDIIAKHVSSIE